MAFVAPFCTTVSASSFRSATFLGAQACKPCCRKPRHALVRMAAQEEGTEEEVSVPLSALKDMKQASSAKPARAQEEVQEEEEEDLRSEREKEIDRLRAAEKFITIDEGNYECTSCGYVYEPAKGERQSRIAAGTAFEDLPSSYYCPLCRSPKSRFVSKKKVIAGFADNQKYGFGSNTLTGGQKSALIYGGLLLCFLLLLSGYALN